MCRKVHFKTCQPDAAKLITQFEFWLSRLYGRAHAGSKGNSTALIKALQFCTDQIQISDKKVGEFIECEEPALLSCNSSGFLEMRCQGDAQEGADLREAFALVTIPDHEVNYYLNLLSRRIPC